MRFALGVLGIGVPVFLKKKMLVELSCLTARSFGVPSPNFQGLSYDRMLAAFALFTKVEAEELARERLNVQAVRDRLFQNSRELGERLRSWFRLQTLEDIFLLSRRLYQVLGIDLEGRPDGEILIRRCFFSRSYTPEVCRIISSLDEGMAAGLSGGCRLDFYQRITEGHGSCRARLADGGEVT